MVGSRSATAAPLSVGSGSIHCRAASASAIGASVVPSSVRTLSAARAQAGQRRAISQSRRICCADVGRVSNGPRIVGAAGAGATCYMLCMDTPINILDVVYDEDAEGGWLTNQVQHAIGQLALLLGRPGKTMDGKERLIPRDFEPEEAGVLDRALMLLYQDVTPSTPLNQMPLLSDLMAVLGSLREPEAQRLARTIRIKLFGTDDLTATAPNTAGHCFNRHTEVDWRFGADITYYNTANVPTMYRPFFYLQIIGAILRFMRDPNRDRSRKTMLAIDEFGYVTQVEALARLAAMICKVARKYGIGPATASSPHRTNDDTHADRRAAAGLLEPGRV